MSVQNRINTRLPEQLAQYVDEICGESGLYETASEFIRDLIRQHYEKSEAQKWQNLKTKLAFGANAEFKEFQTVNPSEQLNSFKERYKNEQ